MSSSRPIGGMEGRMVGGVDPSLPINKGKKYCYQYGKGILLSIRERNTTINTGKEYYYQYGEGILPSIRERNIIINRGRYITIDTGKDYYYQ